MSTTMEEQQKNGTTGTVSAAEMRQDIEELKKAQAVQVATDTGAHATQAAMQAGAQATQAAATAGLAAAVAAGAIGLVVGMLLGSVFTSG